MVQPKVVGIPDGKGGYKITDAIGFFNISSGTISDVINHSISSTAHLSDCKIGVNLLKTKSDTKGNAIFNQFIRGRVNPNVGGYYYAYAYQNEGYVEASGRIPLAQCSVSKIAGKRRAYVSMGVLCNGSTYRFFDVGVANDGYGWYPYVHGMNVYTYDVAQQKYVLNGDIQYFHTGNLAVKTNRLESGAILPGSGAVTLKLEAGVYTDRDYVRFTYTCGSLTGTIAFNAAKGTMHTRSNNKPVVRFYRFMSLVPLTGNGENDGADSSGLSAAIDTLKLGTATWDAAKIQHAYASQIENVKSLMVSTLTPECISANQDYCYICHDTPTHPTA